MPSLVLATLCALGHSLPPPLSLRAPPLASIAGRRSLASIAGGRGSLVRACAAEETATGTGGRMATAVSADGSISAKAVVTTPLVAEATRLQGLGMLAAAALGRALTCTLLVADGLKDEETFQVTFNGDGPLRGVMATANGKLESRGYVGNPAVTLPPTGAGKLDVGGGVGKGSLQVVRQKHLPGADLPSQYSSITEIRTGEIPEDINYFLLESEQRQGALAAGVFVSPVAAGGAAEGREESGELQPPAADAPPSAGVRVDAGGGWYVQLLPFAAEESIVRLEENIAKLASRSPTSLVREGLGPREIVDLLLDGLEPVFADDKPVAGLAESCPCSEARAADDGTPRGALSEPSPPLLGARAADDGAHPARGARGDAHLERGHRGQMRVLRHPLPIDARGAAREARGARVRRVGAEAEGGERRGRSSRAVRRPGASPAAAHQPTRLRTAPAPAATGRRHARTLSVRDPGMSTRLERLRCQGRLLGGRPSRPPYFFPRVDDRMAVVWSSTGGGGAVHRRCVRSLAVRPGVRPQQDHRRGGGTSSNSLPYALS